MTEAKRVLIDIESVSRIEEAVRRLLRQTDRARARASERE